MVGITSRNRPNRRERAKVKTKRRNIPRARRSSQDSRERDTYALIRALTRRADSRADSAC
eukprot:5112400-Pyramimonas_sp.AAC.1